MPTRAAMRMRDPICAAPARPSTSISAPRTVTTRLGSAKTSSATAAAFSPDGRAVAGTSGDGSVTVWDARPAELQDIDFNWKVEKSAEACTARGWRHRVFPGLSRAEEVNLRWLSMARREQPWMPAARVRLREITRGPDVTFGDIASADEGGYLLSTLWHLAWRGDVQLDLAGRWGEGTRVVWAGERS